MSDKYDSLANILREALEQASSGKGKERHAGEGEAFEDQQIVQLGEWLGTNHFQLGQACKKILESARLPPERARIELLGAINYLAAAVIQTDRAQAAGGEMQDTHLGHIRAAQARAAERVLVAEADATVPGVQQVTDSAPPAGRVSGCMRGKGHAGGCVRGGMR